jgi:hypothetical protein
MKLPLLAVVSIAAAISPVATSTTATPVDVPTAQKGAAMACTAPAFATPDAAARAFAGGVPGWYADQRWLAGDGGWTIAHPKTCNVLHLFGDTAVLDSQGSRHMPHGTAVIQTKDSLRWITKQGSLVPDSADGTIDWPGAPVWDGGKLMVFTSHIKPISVGWEDHGKSLAQFTWDGKNALNFEGVWRTPSSNRATEIPQPDGSTKYTISWGNAVVAQGKFVYVYGTYHEAGWFGRRVYLARVPMGSLHTYSQWRYWTGAGWDGRESVAKPIISEQNGDGTEDSFSATFHDAKFSLVSKRGGGFGHDIVRWSAPTPYGPFSETVLAQAPWTPTFQTYLPIEHTQMGRYKNGQIPLTVSHNLGAAGTLDDLFLNPFKYQNQWMGVPK